MLYALSSSWGWVQDGGYSSYNGITNYDIAVEGLQPTIHKDEIKGTYGIFDQTGESPTEIYPINIIAGIQPNTVRIKVTNMYRTSFEPSFVLDKAILINKAKVEDATRTNNINLDVDVQNNLYYTERAETRDRNGKKLQNFAKTNKANNTQYMKKLALATPKLLKVGAKLNPFTSAISNAITLGNLAKDLIGGIFEALKWITSYGKPVKVSDPDLVWVKYEDTEIRPRNIYLTGNTYNTYNTTNIYQTLNEAKTIRAGTEHGTTWKGNSFSFTNVTNPIQMNIINQSLEASIQDVDVIMRESFFTEEEITEFIDYLIEDFSKQQEYILEMINSLKNNIDNMLNSFIKKERCICEQLGNIKEVLQYIGDKYETETENSDLEPIENILEEISEKISDVKIGLEETPYDESY